MIKWGDSLDLLLKRQQRVWNQELNRHLQLISHLQLSLDAGLPIVPYQGQGTCHGMSSLNVHSCTTPLSSHGCHQTSSGQMTNAKAISDQKNSFRYIVVEVPALILKSKGEEMRVLTQETVNGCQV